MLLKMLYDFAQERKLFESVHLQARPIHFLIPITSEGRIEGNGVLPLYSKSAKGRDVLGSPRAMPRFPGENNGGKAHFLAESCLAVLGIDKDTGQGIPIPSGKLENAAKSFLHFWKRIEIAHNETSLLQLEALLRFRKHYLYIQDGRAMHRLPFIEIRKSKTGKNEVGVLTSTGGWERLRKATLTFQVNGSIVFSGDPQDPLTLYWMKTYRQEAFEGENQVTEDDCATKAGLCLVTGKTGVTIARSHKPKILRVPNLTSGGYLVSFAKECPAFSSYGFEMGENAPVSEEAASTYALALQTLIDNENHSLKIGPMMVCFWAKESKEASTFVAQMLRKPDPKGVAEFLKSPWAGLDRHIARLDQFYSVTLSGNAGRVVVRHWVQTTVDRARENFKKWFEDLAIVHFSRFSGQEQSEEKGTKEKKSNVEEELPPFSIHRLANATVRDPKKLGGDVPLHLYRAALENTSMPASVTRSLLYRLNADLSKYGTGILETPIPRRTANAIRDTDQPIPPPGLSRFALLKLILNRNRKEGEPMIEPQIFETQDAAYNCGRLLAVFDELQMVAHEWKLEGPGVVERYYGSASSAPNTAFGILWRLHQHHLRKLSQKGDKGRAAAESIKRRIGEICSLFSQAQPGLPPEFPRVFSLTEQGRFAIGFYQQKAAEDAARKEYTKNKQKGENQTSGEENQ